MALCRTLTILRLDVQSVERAATPVFVAKSKKFRGSLDMTYITKEMTNDDIGSAPSTLNKHGVVFGKTLRKVCVCCCCCLWSGCVRIS